ncbi:hypothetical protein PVA45_02135 [Entomospira entomophila]|uniref:Uncharacterized protein n=1 Tax=Entomospira entomophila TaxID=2719988 RepID=A0A968G9B8_9SPIO|nr:hypothetical protein [Entomospira entomophilus]NIZ40312.1 hypothetical protein [Entomospira entomophilus]WDI35871.1 hypothetical protein PVA45_02135 [Entomospira entomophilus]
MKFSDIYVRELRRLLRRRAGLWLHLFIQSVTSLLYIFVYQFPLHIESSPYGFAQALAFVSLLILPIFVINDLHIHGFRAKDRLWLHLPQNPSWWILARSLAWFTLHSAWMVFFIFWLIVGHYWFFFDLGLVVGAMMLVSVVSFWSIILSFTLRAILPWGWLSLLSIYTITLGFLFLDVVSALLWQRFTLLAQIFEWFSYRYRTTNWQRGMLSLADLSFWIAMIGGLWLLLEYKVLRQSGYRRARDIRMCVGVLLFLLVWLIWPVEIDMTLNQLHRPSKAMQVELNALDQPLFIERLVTPLWRRTGNERWFMRRVHDYQRRDASVHVTQTGVSASEAEQRGLQSFTQMQAQPQFAGMFVNYRDLATQEAVLYRVQDLDEALVLATRRLHGGLTSRRLTVLADEAYAPQDFSIMYQELSREFEVNWISPAMFDQLPYLISDGYVIIGGHDLSEREMQYLENERMRGKNLWINTMGVRISADSEYYPMRYDFSIVDQYLKEKDLEIGRNLLMDPDGYLMRSGAGYLNYPLWISSRVESRSLLGQAMVGVAPLMSVNLSSTSKEVWRPILLSSRLVTEQKGSIALTLLALENFKNEQYQVPRWIMAQYQKEKEESGELIVFASTTWLSNMIEDAQTYLNKEQMKAMARYVTGDKGLLKSQIRFNIVDRVKRPFAPQEMAGRYVAMLFTLFLLWVMVSVIWIILGKLGEVRIK